MEGGRSEGGMAPRRRDAARTREAILDAATARFASAGYERSGAREIAADAGVTAALVNRYFGSKEGLFAAVIGRAFDPSGLIDGPIEGLADRLARRVVEERAGLDGAGGSPPVLLLLRSATEPKAAALLRENLDRQFVRPLADRIGGDEALLRAGLVTSTLTGFATLSRSLRTEAFRAVDTDRLVAALAGHLSSVLSGR